MGPVADDRDGTGRAVVDARTRALMTLGAMIAGIVLSLQIQGVSPAWWLGIAGASALLGWTARGRVCKLALLGAVVAAGGGWATLRLDTAANGSVLAMLPAGDDAVPVRVEGVVTRDAEPVDRPASLIAPAYDTGAAVRFELGVAGVETDAGWRSAGGTAVVRVASNDTSLWLAGDRVRVLGVLRRPGRAMNPGESDWLRLARQRGRIGTLRVDSAELIERIEPRGAVQSAHSWWLSARGVARRRVVRALVGDAQPTPERALVLALLLGRREPAFNDVYDSFRHIGAAHLMAISGFHLMILAGLAVLIVRATGERGWVEPALVAALVLGYMLVLPARAPIVRAGVMVLAVLATDALGRRYDRIAMLAWIGVGLLVWRPLDALSLGFQLSLGITGLLLFMGERARRDPLRGFRSRSAMGAVGRYVRSLVVVCVACWAVAQPAIAVHTGTLSPAAPIASVLMLPLVVVTLAAGYVAAVVGLVAPALSGWTSGLVTMLGSWSIDLAGWVERVPGAWMEVAPPSVWWGACATLACVWVVLRVRDVRAWMGVVVAVLWLVLLVVRGGALPADVRLRVDMLGVGDGSCLLIRSGGEAMLWDCGSLRAGMGDESIPRALRALGVSRIESAVVTHGNVDHFNALPEIAGRFGVRRVRTTRWMLDEAGRSGHAPERVLVGYLESHGVAVEPVKQGQSWMLGPARVDVLWPPEPGDFEGELASNDASMVVLVRVRTDAGDRALLLTGDIQGDGIAGVLDSVPGLRADIIELPHHGGYLPESAVFVGRVGAGVVLQSTGRGRMDEPRWGALRAERVWLSTARDGAVFAEVRSDGSIRAGPSR